jgi:hypothetical protein
MRLAEIPNGRYKGHVQMSAVAMGSNPANPHQDLK